MKRAIQFSLILSTCFVSARVWAGPFSLVPKGHWAYAALDELAKAGYLDRQTLGAAEERSCYEVSQQIVQAAQHWEKASQNDDLKQVGRHRDQLMRLIDEFSESIALFNITPQSLKDRLQPVVVTPATGQTEAKPTTPEVRTPAAKSNSAESLPLDMSALIGMTPVDSPFADLASRLEPNTILRSLVSQETNVESHATIGPMPVTSVLRSSSSQQSSPATKAARDLMPLIPAGTENGAHSQTVPYLFSTDVSLPLTDKVSLLAAYSHALDNTFKDSSAWQAGAMYSPGRMSIGASLHSLDEGFFAQKVLSESLSGRDTGRDTFHSNGRISGFTGFVGYKWGAMDLAGRLEGYGDETSLGLMRYTGQVGYRSLRDRLVLGLTLTRSYSFRPDLLDTLNTSFGVGYAITSTSKLEFTYMLRDYNPNGLPTTDLDRTHVLAGKFSVRF